MMSQSFFQIVDGDIVPLLLKLVLNHQPQPRLVIDEQDAEGIGVRIAHRLTP